jgi:geranylgeranyl pyrophosphate synthase
VIDIFRKKTSTAFEVALQFGALAAGCDQKVCGIISRFSDALGIAYQIRDDLEDMTSGDSMSDLLAMRPTLPLALLLERVRGQAQHKELVESSPRVLQRRGYPLLDRIGKPECQRVASSRDQQDIHCRSEGLVQ